MERMERKPMGSALEIGPLYFFDQLQTKAQEKSKKIPKELCIAFKYLIPGPHFAATIERPSKFMKSEEQKEGVLFQQETPRKKKHLIPSSTLETNEEDSKPSQIPPVTTEDADLPMSLFDEYRFASSAILKELGQMLHFFADRHITFPQGIANLVNYSWKELTEGAVYRSTQHETLADKKERSLKGRGSVTGDKVPLGTEHLRPEVTENARGQVKKYLFIGGEKDKSNHDNASKKILANKGPVPQSTNFPVKIRFSMSSKYCEEKGWIFQHSNSDAEAMELKALLVCAVERLQQAQIQINREKDKLRKMGFSKPVILRHYDDSKKEISVKKFQRPQCFWIELLKNKTQIPVIKQPDPTLNKLHYALVDGSSSTYYPSGQLAICQSYSNLPAGGVYTNVFSDSLDHDVLGTFTPFGYGSVSFPHSQIIAMMFNRRGGVLTSRRGETVREWKWPRVGKLDDPVFIQVNKYITVKIAGRFAVDLFYKWQGESLKLSVATAQDSGAPCFEVDQVVTSVKFIPKSLKEVHKLNRKKLREKEAKKPNQESSDHSEPVKTLERPEVDGSLVNDCSAIRELRKLQKKIRSIVDDWIKHYRLAFGIGSPQISRITDVPQGILRKCKVQPVRALPVAPMVQNEEEKVGDTEVPEAGNSLRQPMDCFQPASARNMPTETSIRSHSLRVSSLTKSSIKPDHLTVPQTTLTMYTSQFQSSWISGLPLSYDNEKFWFTSHLTCPVVLRRTLRGEAGKVCKCSNQQIPYVTDLEYDHIINNQMSSPEQITVICVLATFQTEKDVMEDEVEELYRRKNKTRNMPCMQSRLDSFRLLKYIIYPADEFRGQKGSLLVQRHNAAPGMFLMYIQGRLLFANYIFNGYSTSAKDLQKQIVKSRSDYKMGFCLPDDFRFSSHVDDLTLASS